MIYFLQRANGDIKIGTTINFDGRFTALERKHGKLTLLGIMDGDRDQEQAAHRRFSEERIELRQEWFHPSKRLLQYIEANTTLNVPRLTFKMSNVVLSYEVAEALTILRRRFKVRSSSEALRQFMRLHDPKTLQRAQEICLLQKELNNVV